MKGGLGEIKAVYNSEMKAELSDAGMFNRHD